MSHGVTGGSSSPPLWTPWLPIEDEEVDDKVAWHYLRTPGILADCLEGQALQAVDDWGGCR